MTHAWCQDCKTIHPRDQHTRPQPYGASGYPQPAFTPETSPRSVQAPTTATPPTPRPAQTQTATVPVQSTPTPGGAAATHRHEGKCTACGAIFAALRPSPAETKRSGTDLKALYVELDRHKRRVKELERRIATATTVLKGE